MTFLRSSRLPVLAALLCVALMGFAGTSFAVVRWDVVPSPTEVITIGRSEVVGSVTLFARGTGFTGTSTNGNAQIGIIFTNPAMQIDNDLQSGIVLIRSASLTSATIINVENKDINGRCSGFITVNVPYGITVADGEFLRVEGVRGRIDLSGPPQGITAGTDLYASIQSVNDPAANLFTPDIVRVAKSLCPYFVEVKSDTVLLCFPTLGKYESDLEYSITITEGFARAFVDMDSNGSLGNDKARVDSNGDLIGEPNTNTLFRVYLRGIPASVEDIDWEASVPSNQNLGGDLNSYLVLDDASDISASGEAYADYIFVSNNQTDFSDATTEVFKLVPKVVLYEDNNTGDVGQIKAGVQLGPFAETLKACDKPGHDDGDKEDPEERDRPRFVKAMRALKSNCVPPDEELQPYADVIRCNCYLLFTYVTADSAYDTGMVVANTSGDTAVFGTELGAPDQQGPVTFYFYDKTAQYVGSTKTATDVLPGQSLVTLLSALLPTTPAPVKSFSGYVIAKTSFQFCHGFAYIADKTFANVAQGYLANVIPDPGVKGQRSATAAADVDIMLPAGESLNN